mmetsp:Transcript_50306/g.157154  ORF Transcript_50306/g.157154 Transcript_50306/m.157154 type:complete len:338 (-) Transcript_50306:1179-2192(-)
MRHDLGRFGSSVFKRQVPHRKSRGSCRLLLHYLPLLPSKPQPFPLVARCVSHRRNRSCDPRDSLRKNRGRERRTNRLGRQPGYPSRIFDHHVHPLQVVPAGSRLKLEQEKIGLWGVRHLLPPSATRSERSPRHCLSGMVLGTTFQLSLKTMQGLSKGSVDMELLHMRDLFGRRRSSRTLRVVDEVEDSEEEESTQDENKVEPLMVELELDVSENVCDCLAIHQRQIHPHQQYGRHEIHAHHPCHEQDEHVGIMNAVCSILQVENLEPDLKEASNGSSDQDSDEDKADALDDGLDVHVLYALHSQESDGEGTSHRVDLGDSVEDDVDTGHHHLVHAVG